MYKERFDKREVTELRPMSAKTGVVPRADGSAMFQIGKTIAIAAVYGPKMLHPRHLQNPERGVLRCEYNMMAFSGSGERVRPGPSRRSKEISYITEQALLPALDLKEFPNTVVDIHIELIQTDAGTRCAGIVAASMALADAGFPMKDLVSAIGIGRIDDKVVVDVNKEEEDYEGGMCDMPIACMPRTGEVTLLQCDGYLTQKQLKEAIEKGIQACQEIKKVQEKALAERFIQ